LQLLVAVPWWNIVFFRLCAAPTGCRLCSWTHLLRALTFLGHRWGGRAVRSSLSTDWVSVQDSFDAAIILHGPLGRVLIGAQKHVFSREAARDDAR
jgi:hypothetical protein